MKQATKRIGSRLSAALSGGGMFRIPPVPCSAQAMIALALRDTAGGTVVLITDGSQAQEQLHQDVVTIAAELYSQSAGGGAVLFYPASETGASGDSDIEITGQRIEVLCLLSDGKERPVVVTCVQALMQKAVAPDALRKRIRTFSVGDEEELQAVTAFLVEGGYEPVPEVGAKGEMCVKGGLLDLWPPAEIWPVRLEFEGEEIESIRRFDPATQLWVEKIETVTVSPASDMTSAHGEAPADDGGAGAKTSDADALLISYLTDDACLVWCDPESIRESAALYEESSAESGGSDRVVTLRRLKDLIAGRSRTTQVEIGAMSTRAADDDIDILPVRGVPGSRPEMFQPDLLEEARRQFIVGLTEAAGRGRSVYLFFDTQGALDHFVERFAGAGHELCSGLNLRVGILSEGFASDRLGLVLAGESDLYGRRKALGRRYDPNTERARPDPNMGLRVADLTSIEPGDLVVHDQHGVGQYRGLCEILVSGQAQEVLSIEYAEGAVLHVPVSHAHLLTRYVGASKNTVKLHRIGGKRWSGEKAAAQRAIEDLAASLLETQAQREVLKGHAFASDTAWQHEFDASFPFRETVDQIRAIRAIKSDMESGRPMDRLVCGDAGYGKTEVAMRAAFKAVMDTRQVALLVPTTVLALQHFDTFVSRMAAYPVRIEMLSRFCTGAQRARIAADLAAGVVDIVIGTHALLQPGIRFKDLGLVVIDEEQRFGVKHKEWLKNVRHLVDVLTLTATPIPRTLYMSLAGARDMSLIQTPPVERTAIETTVTKDSDKVIREAILREMGRDGQVFFLHNRVMTIEMVRARLERVVPEARLEVAHGRMAAGELARVMHRFVLGGFDVLLCTTIIESGMDIPRANTIIIDRADRFGIADLYQLRGRVGRSSHKGYAILMLPSHGIIDQDARRRIDAIRKYSALSAGFSLALRDMEIRGSGNILGAQQSGHITAIGFGLYCQFLKRTVARLRHEDIPPVIDVDARLDFLEFSPRSADRGNAAMIPYAYVDDESLRVELYRRMAGAAETGGLSALEAEIVDRFGPIPAPVGRLLKVARLRILCSTKQVRSVDVRGGKVLLSRSGGYLAKNGRFPRLRAASADTQLDELLTLVSSVDEWSASV